MNHRLGIVLYNASPYNCLLYSSTCSRSNSSLWGRECIPFMTWTRKLSSLQQSVARAFNTLNASLSLALSCFSTSLNLLFEMSVNSSFCLFTPQLRAVRTRGNFPVLYTLVMLLVFKFPTRGVVGGRRIAMVGKRRELWTFSSMLSPHLGSRNAAWNRFLVSSGDH